MAVTSPVSQRSTVAALLLLTFATGLADSISILVLGHVFVANMTGNVIFLGFWLAPRTSVDLTAVVVALPTFVCTTILSGRMSRHFADRTRPWITTVLAVEIGLLVVLAIAAGAGILQYHNNTKLIIIAMLAVTFGLQHSSARAARTALAYSRQKDEMYVFEGGSYTPDNMQDLFRGLGSDNAVLLDGGGSSAIVLRRDTGGMWAGTGSPRGSCDTRQVLCDSHERALPSWLAFN